MGMLDSVVSNCSSMPQGIIPFGDNQYLLDGQVLSTQKFTIHTSQQLKLELDILEFRKQRLPCVYGIVDYMVEEQTLSCGSQYQIIIFLEKNWGRLQSMSLMPTSKAISCLSSILKGYKTIIENCRAKISVSDRTIFFDQFNRLKVWVGPNPASNMALHSQSLTGEEQHEMVEQCFAAIESHCMEKKLPLSLYTFLERSLWRPLTLEGAYLCVEQYRRREEQSYPNKLQAKRKIVLPRRSKIQ